MSETRERQEKINKIWTEYASSRAVELKNELVMHYLYLVKNIVFRLLPTYENYSSYDDLSSCGVLGLMDAIEKFDLERGVKFESYAGLRIKGEIIDHIRKQDWAPYSLRQRIKSISTAYTELEMELGRKPSDSEVAAHLDIKEADVQKAMTQSHMFNVVYFEEQITEYQTWGDTVEDKRQTPEEMVEKQDVIRVLGEMIDDLPEREKQVITLYYYEELTLKEIANILGMSESRISQIHSKLLLQLRSKLEKAFSLKI